MKRYMLFLVALGVTLCSYGQQFWELNPQKADLSARRIYRTEVDGKISTGRPFLPYVLYSISRWR